ncbi:MAG TPA: glutamine amidotransferase [Burkholderiaceae bacterium]
MKPLVILKVGNTLPQLQPQYGDFEHWITTGLADSALNVQVIDPRRGDALPAADDISGAVVTGSHAMVTERLDWSEASAAWLAQLVEAEIPLLGICYGHQLLAHAMGGEAGYHPRGMEIGTQEIRRLAVDDALFCGLPDTFFAQTVHQQSALRLPPRAVLLASNGFDAHHAFRIGACAWGVQFHPEFSAAAMRTYVRHLAPLVAKQGGDADEIEAAVQDTPVAAGVLARFAQIVRHSVRHGDATQVRQIATFS